MTAAAAPTLLALARYAAQHGGADELEPALWAVREAARHTQDVLGVTVAALAMWAGGADGTAVGTIAGAPARWEPPEDSTCAPLLTVAIPCPRCTGPVTLTVVSLTGIAVDLQALTDANWAENAIAHHCPGPAVDDD